MASSPSHGEELPMTRCSMAKLIAKPAAVPTRAMTWSDVLRQALLATPNVRAKRATTAGRQARTGENVPRTARPGLVACRWRSA